MSPILEIKKYPDKILLHKCQLVEKITEKEIALFNDMLATMRNSSGLGLAAPQIGINKRLIIADVGEGPLYLANPELIKFKGKDEMEEGCLSVPDTQVKIERPYEIIVQGLNAQGETEEIKAKGFLARVLLHEIDHLNGKLIIDYMNFLKKLEFKLRDKRRGRCLKSKEL